MYQLMCVTFLFDMKYESQAMNAANVWHTMALRKILSPISPANYIKEMPLLQEM